MHDLMKRLKKNEQKNNTDPFNKGIQSHISYYKQVRKWRDQNNVMAK